MLAKGLSPSFPKSLARSMFDSGEPLSPDEQARFREVVFDTAAQAYGHLDRARSSLPFLLSIVLTSSIRRALQEKLSSSSRSSCIHTMLPAVLAAEYLEELRKADFNPLSPQLLTPRSHFWKQVNLLKSVFTGRI